MVCRSAHIRLWQHIGPERTSLQEGSSHQAFRAGITADSECAQCRSHHRDFPDVNMQYPNMDS